MRGFFICYKLDIVFIFNIILSAILAVMNGLWIDASGLTFIKLLIQIGTIIFIGYCIRCLFVLHRTPINVDTPKDE